MYAQDLRVSSLFRDQMFKHSPQKMRTLLRVSSLLLAFEINPNTAETICEASCPFPINHSQRTEVIHISRFLAKTYQLSVNVQAK